MRASTSLLLAPLPSISLGDKIHKAERTGTVHAGIMWQHAVKHFLSTASAGVVVAAFWDGFLCSFQSCYLVFLRLVLVSGLLCEGLSLVSQFYFKDHRSRDITVLGNHLYVLCLMMVSVGRRKKTRNAVTRNSHLQCFLISLSSYSSGTLIQLKN